MIYLDLAVALNFGVDFLLLLGTNRLTGFPPGLKRLIQASALGAAYAAGSLVPGFRFLGNWLWRLVSLVLMAGVAFGWNRSALRRGGIFVLLSMSLGGIVTALESAGLSTILLSAAGVWLLCRVGFGSGVGAREYIPLTICSGKKTIHLTALRDTGNTLKDPITGEQVLVIDSLAASELTGLTAQQLGHPMETLAQRVLPGLRLIPYRAVGQSGGMLLAKRYQNVRVGNQTMAALVAFAPEPIGNGEGYQALTGGVI